MMGSTTPGSTTPGSTTLNLGRLIHEHATYAPARVAVRFGEQRLSYADLDAAASRVANHLVSLGLTPGDRVALSCPNLPYFPIVYYGALRAGMVVVPLNVLFKAREIQYHLEDAGARAYFAFEGTADLPIATMGKAAFDAVPGCEHFVVMTADAGASSPIEGAPTLGQILASQPAEFDLHPTRAEDTAVILYTSGTTGQPKGAELSHLNMVMNAVISSQLFTVPDQDPSERVFLMVLPLFHSFGQTCGMNAMFYSGGQITLLPRFEAARALKTMLEHGVTAFAGVPTMYWAMLNEAEALSEGELSRLREQLRVAASGGAAMPVELLKSFESTFGVPILEGYGLSETSPVASFNHLGRARKPGSIGQPIWGVEMRVADESDRTVEDGELGEILIRGHNVMKGYYRRPEASAEALRGGWFHSGDLGRRDAEGYFYIVDRVKDMIVRGGFNVYPREVEEVMMTHPEISMVAVVGVPHDALGEEICAYVVPKAGTNPEPEMIIAWCKEQMAAYKYPRQVILRESLPMNATGKILKRELRQEGRSA